MGGDAHAGQARDHHQESLERGRASVTASFSSRAGVLAAPCFCDSGYVCLFSRGPKRRAHARTCTRSSLRAHAYAKRNCNGKSNTLDIKEIEYTLDIKQNALNLETGSEGSSAKANGLRGLETLPVDIKQACGVPPGKPGKKPTMWKKIKLLLP